MPDFTYEVFYHCASAENWSTQVEGSKGKKYTVTWEQGREGHDYTCTCQAFKFGRKACKHIKQVEQSDKHCKWLQFIDGDKPKMENNEAHCPKCGCQAFAQRWAV